MSSILKSAINRAFGQLNISLDSDTSHLAMVKMPNGQTNQFAKVCTQGGKEYLIRINGKLWPPFTRAHESFNLRNLQLQAINTHVLYSDKAHAFQICELKHTSTKASNPAIITPKFLLALANTLRTVHENCTFKGEYRLHHTLIHSYQKLPRKERVRFKAYHALLLRLILTLHLDTNNHVASHNDLLPSSVHHSNGVVSIVDWEYSAPNHRAYDIGFFSQKASLSPQDEACLLEAYKPAEALRLKAHVTYVKSIVSFLYYCWNTRREHASFHINLTETVQAVLFAQCAGQIMAEQMLYCFSEIKKQTKEHLPSSNTEIALIRSR